MATSEDPVRRWRRLVRAKRAEMERLAPDDWPSGPSMWDRRAEAYAERVAGTARRDPFTRRVRRHVGRCTVVVDVGAGTGRFSLAFAPHAAEVVAVDVSDGMLAVLRRDADQAGIDNVRTVHARWEEAGDVTGDVVICSYVLPVIAEPLPFLRKLDSAARRRVFLYLGAASPDLLLDPFWRWFHGRPRQPGPTYLDAVALLGTLGVTPDVRVVEVRSSSRFADLDAAVADYRRTLCLPDTADTRGELRGLLASWLVPVDGALRAPVRTLPAAIVSWSPDEQRGA